MLHLHASSPHRPTLAANSLPCCRPTLKRFLFRPQVDAVTEEEAATMTMPSRTKATSWRTMKGLTARSWAVAPPASPRAGPAPHGRSRMSSSSPPRLDPAPARARCLPHSTLCNPSIRCNTARTPRCSLLHRSTLVIRPPLLKSPKA